jgi:hypothetical protein
VDGATDFDKFSLAHKALIAATLRRYESRMSPK